MIGSWLYFGKVNSSTLIECTCDKVVDRVGRKGPIFEKEEVALHSYHNFLWNYDLDVK